jgi:hypothetical protein
VDTATDPDTLRLQSLVQRAQQGDRSALPELKAALDEDATLWQRHGDLAYHAQTAWLDLVGGADLLLRECVERKLAELRAELAGPAPTKLEGLLVERVAACWLQLHFADASYAQTRSVTASASTRKELLQRQVAAERRYLAAIKQLALVQKLLKPATSADRAAESNRAGTATRWPVPPGARVALVG